MFLAIQSWCTLENNKCKHVIRKRHIAHCSLQPVMFLFFRFRLQSPKFENERGGPQLNSAARTKWIEKKHFLTGQFNKNADYWSCTLSRPHNYSIPLWASKRRTSTVVQFKTKFRKYVWPVHYTWTRYSNVATFVKLSTTMIGSARDSTYRIFGNGKIRWRRASAHSANRFGCKTQVGNFRVVHQAVVQLCKTQRCC